MWKLLLENHYSWFFEIIPTTMYENDDLGKLTSTSANYQQFE